MRQLILAFQFLTIIPIRVKGNISPKEISQSAAFFPIVGAFQGLLAALAASLLIKFFSSEITSGLIILILVICNGGFHLDGLADTFDALAVKSSGEQAIDRKKRLSVMKDSSTGAIGVVAIVLTILLKFLFINNLFLKLPAFSVYSILFLMPVFSKWMMIPAMYHGVSARQDGLGEMFINNIKVNTIVFSFLLIIFFYLLISELHLRKAYGSNTTALFLILFPVLYIFSFISVRFCTRKFGGLTGDTLGAISEITEVIFLFMVIVWSRFSI